METSPLVLNLGCGTKASASPNVVNIDWSIHLRIRSNRALWALRRWLLDAERRRAIESLPDNIVLWNLRKGIPFDDASVDAVYHSHLIEHLNRDVAPSFLREVLRVLRPGGVHRLAVPDFERSCRLYLDHVKACDADPQAIDEHEDVLATVIDQLVRTEAYGSSQRSPARRRVENLLLGSAAQRGQTHRWMYDRYSLPKLLESVGFRTARAVPWNESQIPGWADYGLEVDDLGDEYRTDSFYVEATK